MPASERRRGGPAACVGGHLRRTLGRPAFLAGYLAKYKSHFGPCHDSSPRAGPLLRPSLGLSPVSAALTGRARNREPGGVLHLHRSLDEHAAGTLRRLWRSAYRITLL